MNLDEYIRSECDRGHTTNYQEMRDAYDHALTACESVESLVSTLGNLVEPEVNPPAGFRHNYRTSNDGFMHGGPLCPASEVPLRMERWVDSADSVLDRNYQCSEKDAHLLIRIFLDIHPFVDGNGRVASILYNLMIGKLGDPEPLPYYYLPSP